MKTKTNIISFDENDRYHGWIEIYNSDGEVEQMGEYVHGQAVGFHYLYGLNLISGYGDLIGEMYYIN